MMPELEQLSASDYLAHLKKLKNDRANYDSQYQAASKYCMPDRAEYTGNKAEGQGVDIDVFDSTAMESALIMGSGLHAYMTNPASEWFQFAMQNRKLGDIKRVSNWLSELKRVSYNVLNGSNFNEEIAETLYGLTVVGVNCFYSEEDAQDVIRFFDRNMKEIYLVLDAAGRLHMVYRVFELKIREAYDAWGKNAGKKVVEQYEKEKNYEGTCDYVHVVGPRHVRNPNYEDGANLPWFSKYIEMESAEISEEGGYHEMPYSTARYRKALRGAYGFSPAMVALPDIKMSQRIAETILIAGQKAVDPVTVFPHDGFVLPADTNAGGRIYQTRRDNPHDTIYTIHDKINLPYGRDIQEDYRNSIRKKFFVDLFLMLADKQTRTAYEVAKMVEEKMLILGPFVGRLMSMLDSTLHRLVGIILRSGMIEPPPQEIAKENYVIDYVSPLARAQKLSTTQNLTQYLAVIGEMAKFAPDVLKIVNSIKAGRYLAEQYSIEPKILNSDEEVDRMIAEEQKARAEERQILLLQGGAKAAKDGAGAAKDVKEAKEPAAA